MSVYFRLYASNGTDLIYTFPIVFEANYPHTEKDLIEHRNVRGKGSIVVDGGNAPWDLFLRGVLFSDGYDALMALVDDMETKVVLNIPYVLKITKSSGGGTTWNYNVKRILPIEYAEDSLRTDYLEYKITFRADCW